MVCGVDEEEQQAKSCCGQVREPVPRLLTNCDRVYPLGTFPAEVVFAVNKLAKYDGDSR